jgi:VWFA-related protein
MKTSRRSFIFGIAASSLAQTFSTNVKVVSLLANVQDKDGKIVKDLTQDDFILEEDGKPQTIRYFSQESDLALTVGLMVDTSRSQTGVLEKERRASYQFLDQVLREDKDVAFVVCFDTGVQTLQGLTSSRKDLAAALDQLQIPGQVATLLFSAIRDSSESIMRKQPGRKALILLTDGVAVRDPVSIGMAIEFAQRADTILYSIRFSDPVGFRGPIRTAVRAAASEHGKAGLERMSKETGGTLYEVSKNETIEEIYSRIEDALRGEYSIGYRPLRPAGDGKYRRIKLTTKDRHLIVRTRDGYYAQ